MSGSSDRYKAAGVDLDAADQALSGIESAVTSTYTPRALRGLGAFGGLFDASGLPERPILVASTDGVGTKTRVAARMDPEAHAWRGIGRDLVNHCVNDVLVQGAQPLFFLDYVASAALDPTVIADLVSGVASACREAGIPLLGGETAEMPGVYSPGEVDVVGTLIGAVGADALLDGRAIREGDVVLGLSSHGLQTNGFSLARSVLEDRYDEALSDGRTVAAHLLAEHRSFLPVVTPLLEAGLLHGMAHVTGGGMPGNLPRVLPEALGVAVDGTWPEPEVFGVIREAGGVSEEEMRRVFNLGIGFVLIVAEADEAKVTALASEPVYRVGRVQRGHGVTWV